MMGELITIFFQSMQIYVNGKSHYSVLSGSSVTLEWSSVSTLSLWSESGNVLEPVCASGWFSETGLSSFKGKSGPDWSGDSVEVSSGKSVTFDISITESEGDKISERTSTSDSVFSIPSTVLSSVLSFVSAEIQKEFFMKIIFL